VDDNDLTDEEYERRAFRVVQLSSLPITDIDLVGWPGADVDWKTAAAVAVQVFNAGIDPIDRDAIERAVNQRQTRKRDREWIIDLFRDPIAIYAKSRRWSNGRHRVEAMRRAGASECVVQVLT
jgi:hypothetical protein